MDGLPSTHVSPDHRPTPPIRAASKRYTDGFVAGALNERPGASMRVTYTGSFLDASLAAEAATAHVGQGADVSQARG